MKITLETSVGGSFNAETGAWDSFPALTVTHQAAKGTKLTSATFAFEDSDPQAMLGAAVAYFRAQEAS